MVRGCRAGVVERDGLGRPNTPLSCGSNPEHMRSNAEVDVVISDDDTDLLRAREAKDYGEHGQFPVYSGK